ncbi:tetraspanin-19 [Dicentrarchus labrax]|uniref:Tetraspanin n=1 Tax=Dicentrarchus labrax TaxID=13489 RepID=A0A8P4G7D6_DICLA|nr:tetraspanin-19 [Dicentrarchus labrax]
MKLEVRIQLLKFCSQVFNCVFLALGLSVAGCAVWILFGTGSLLTIHPSDELRTVGAGLLLIGGVVLLVALIGCLGAAGEKRILLLMYMGFLIVLVLGQLFVTLLLLVSKDKIERTLEDTVDQIILQYRGSSESTDRFMDDAHRYGACCGINGPADWLKNSYIKSLNLTNPDVLPCSCFSSYRPSFNSPWCSELLNFTAPVYGRGNTSYEQGCKEKLSDWLQENVLTVVGMDVGLMLIQVVQFVIMVYLYRAFGRNAAFKRPLVDPDHSHLDHTPEDELDYGEQNYAYIEPDDGYIDPIHPEHHHDYLNHVDPAHLAYHHDNQH